MVRGLLLLLLLLGSSARAGDIDSERQASLRYLVRQDCGSCHGMTLKGGLGPALTAQALTGKPQEWLVNTILDGRPGTPMPPWRGLLSRDEAAWIVRELAGAPQ